MNEHVENIVRNYFSGMTLSQAIELEKQKIKDEVIRKKRIDMELDEMFRKWRTNI
jgi:hypothetical protein